MPTELELYKELGTLTKNKDQWEANIAYVSFLLGDSSIRIHCSGAIKAARSHRK